MANKLRYSPTNPLQFFSKDLDRDGRFNSKDFEDFEFTDTIRSFEQHADWCQPWQLTDTIKLQLETNVGPVNWVLKKVKRNEIVDTVPLANIMESENEPGMFVYELAAPLSGYDEDHFYAELQFGVGGPEPIFVLRTGKLEFAIEHENSLIADYKHFEHQNGIIYETGFYPSVRFFGIVKYIGPKKKATSHEDQILNMIAVRAQKYRAWELKLGKCPDYFSDMMGGVICCQDLKFDGKAFTVPQENELEPVEPDPKVRLRGWSVQMRDRYTRNSKEYENDQPINATVVAIVESDAKGFGGDGTFNNVVHVVT